ncbi:hypothetical protein [Kitasatospora sp. NPDC058190]|uniref:hypothetical protein n=1 Tax=Kitasatospora sp. NPDC058190 TaxID=3346371 RepID=UPI0036D866FB
MRGPAVSEPTEEPEQAQRIGDTDLADVIQSGGERFRPVVLSFSQHRVIFRIAVCAVFTLALLAAPVVTVSGGQERGHFTYEGIDTRLHG